VAGLRLLVPKLKLLRPGAAAVMMMMQVAAVQVHRCCCCYLSLQQQQLPVLQRVLSQLRHLSE
jgi:hypothetical protein